MDHWICFSLPAGVVSGRFETSPFWVRHWEKGMSFTLISMISFSLSPQFRHDYKFTSDRRPSVM